MKIPKGFLFALIIIIITSFVAVGFSQEDKKEGTRQEKATVDQKPSKKDLKPQEEKRLKEKHSFGRNPGKIRCSRIIERVSEKS